MLEDYLLTQIKWDFKHYQQGFPFIIMIEHDYNPFFQLLLDRIKTILIYNDTYSKYVKFDLSI